VARQNSAAVVPASQPEPLWDARQVAAYLGVRLNTVYKWHMNGDAPPAVRLGPRGCLRWRRGDVEAWLDSQLETNGKS
jgi:predicted DNA-binding transcriptional regulator AlpA